MIVTVRETVAIDVPSRAHSFHSPFRSRINFLASDLPPRFVLTELEVVMLIFICFSFIPFLSFRFLPPPPPPPPPPPSPPSDKRVFAVRSLKGVVVAVFGVLGGFEASWKVDDELVGLDILP